MARTDNLTNFLTDVADSIREKKGTSEPILASNFDTEIDSIETSGAGNSEWETIFASAIDDTRGANVTKLPTGIKYIDNYAFHSRTQLRLTSLPDEITFIGDYAFYGCSNLALRSLPRGVIEIGNFAFANDTSLLLTSLPNDIIDIGNNAFNNCSNLALRSLPRGVTRILNNTFQLCRKLTELTVEGDVTIINNYALYGCSGLTKIVFPNVTTVPTLSNKNAFEGTPIASGKGIIFVPNNLVDSFKSATNWSTYAGCISGLNISSIEIIGKDEINTYLGNTLQLKVTYNGGSDSLFYEEQMGYTINIEGNATIDENNLLTLTDNAVSGDVIRITAVSTYDNTITDTKEITVIYKDKYVELDLNNGEWIDSGTTVDGNVVYMSDKNSYHVSNGKSVARINILGYKQVKLYIRSWAEMSWDYIEAFDLDVVAERSKGLYNYYSATAYKECVYNLDGGEHFIEVMYSKDGGGNQNDDRGYFYIGECSL